MKKLNKVLISVLILIFGISAGGIVCRAELILPENSYNYMDYKNPVDLAVNENYYIVAESDCLHIYDRNLNNYTKISPTDTDTAEKIYIEKVFLNNKGIYLLSDTRIYFCDYESTEFNELSLTGNTFAVNGDYLVTATNNYIKLYEYTDGAYNLQGSPLAISGNTVPFLTFENNSDYFYQIGNISNTDTKAIASDGTNIYFIGNSGFYKLSGDTLTTISESTSFIALKYYSGKIFLAEKIDSALSSGNIAKVTSYDIAANSFDNFEISSSSSSDNRLNNAKDIFGINGNLLIADTANKRLSIFEKSGTFINKLNFDYYPYLVAANTEKAIVVTSSSTALTGDSLVFLVDIKNPSSNLTAEKINNTLLSGKNFISVASSDNYFYLLTEKNNDHNAQLTIIPNSGTIQNIEFSDTLYPTKLTCDINGNLFVLFDDDTISKYSDNITQNDNIELGENIANFDLTSNILKFIIDINQIPFVITENNKIYKSDNGIKVFDIPANYDGEQLQSFTSFYDDDNIYFLYSNTIISDNSAGIKTLSSIAIPTDYVLNNDTEIITIKAGIPLLLFDYSEFLINVGVDGTGNFPIDGYIKLGNDVNVIKLFETDEHIVFSGKYTGIVSKDANNVYAYAGNISTETTFTGYLSSKANIYKYPILNSGFSQITLEKYSQVNVTALIYCEDLSCEFYQITYSEDQTGYIPASFVLTDLIENTENEDFSMKKIEGENITLYSDIALTQKIIDLPSGTNIKIYSNSEGTAKISYEDNGTVYIGYIDSAYIIQKGENTLRNVIIILLVVLSFTITTLYLLKPKKRRI